MLRPITTAIAIAISTLGCEPLDATRDVTGNFEIQYVDNLRVFINDEPVAEVNSGEDATVEWDGESFDISAMCSDEGVECPAETFPAAVAVDQPWGSEYRLLNFVNIDTDHEEAGERLGGLMEDDGTFAMLSGLALTGIGGCLSLGVGSVTGAFDESNANIVDGVITFAWAAGCKVNDVEIGGSLRLETDYSAERTGDYDVSSVTPEEPIDENGETVDPEEPGDEYTADGEDTTLG